MLMSSTIKKGLALIVLVAISAPAAGDWRGFHGLEKEGRCDSVGGPRDWSSTQNVVWRTVIPGRGHSSPIVSGNVLYLTTTYESLKLRGLHLIWDYAVFTLTLLFTLVGVCFAIQSLRVKPRGLEELWQHARFFSFALLLGTVVVVALFGRHLLRFDDSTLRSWLASIALIVCCLTCCSLFVPSKSRQHLAVGCLSLTLPVSVWVALKHKGLVFALDSPKDLITTTALISPVMLGCVLLTAYFLAHKRKSVVIQNPNEAGLSHHATWWYIVTFGMGLGFAGIPFFFLLCRAAAYQMPDSYIWHDRINPSVSWWGIGLLVVLVVIAVLGCSKKKVRGGAAVRYSMQLLFLLIALTLGTTYFVRVCLVGNPREFDRAVMCLDRDSGTMLWTCEGLTGKARGRGRTVTHASATPVTDGERIYCYSGIDGLMCVNSEGKLLWKKEEPMFNSKHAVATSPVVEDGILIIVSDVKETEELSSSITAFDGVTGKVLWKKERKSHPVYAAYGTPLIKPLHGKPVIIVHGWYDIKGYDLETGQELWSYPVIHGGKHLVASLVSDVERLYVIGKKQVSAVDISKLGANSDPAIWSTPVAGEKSSTPVVVDGLLFLVTEAGRAFCLDVQTGDMMWEKRLRGRYYSSVVATGTQVFFTSESGQTTIVAVNREFRQLAENVLGGSIYTSFAPVGKQLFVRTDRHLYCIQEDREG